MLTVLSITNLAVTISYMADDSKSQLIAAQERFFAEEKQRRNERHALRIRGNLPPMKHRLVRQFNNILPDEAVGVLMK